MLSALDEGRRDEMNDSIAINFPVATLISVLKRELGDAQILFLLSTGHAPNTPESLDLIRGPEEAAKATED